jgi:hypothetical protein
MNKNKNKNSTVQVCTLLIVGLLYKRPEDMAGLRVA